MVLWYWEECKWHIRSVQFPLEASPVMNLKKRENKKTEAKVKVKVSWQSQVFNIEKGVL